MNSENGIGKLNNLVSKLIKRIELLENQHFEMKRETKLIPDIYDILMEMDVRLSTLNGWILSTLSADANKGGK